MKSALLTQVQVCERLGISDESWRRWRRAGKVPDPVVMPSGRLKWREDDIERIAGRTVSGTGRYFQSGYRRVG